MVGEAWIGSDFGPSMWDYKVSRTSTGILMLTFQST